MNEPLDPNAELLLLMREREKREAVKFEQEQMERMEAEENKRLRLERQKKNDKQAADTEFALQSRCDHRKGTGGKKKWRHIDYMVDRHTLPNGVVRIRCQKCHFRAFPGDTQEICSRTLDNYMKGARRKQYPNPTKRSYEQWYAMTLDENTTNTETRSEMVTAGPQPVTV